MRIVVVCNDTLGGVRPYAALATGLDRAGHNVEAVAPAAHAHLFDDAGIRVTKLSGTTARDLAAAATIAERGTLATMRYMASELPQRLGTWMYETLRASEGADLLTGGIGGMATGKSVAEALAVPFVEAHLQPVGVRTTAYPGVLLPWLPHWLGPDVRRLSHAASDAMITMPFRRATLSARRKVLGLGGSVRRADRSPRLYGFSRAVVDVPSTPARPSSVTGYWERDDVDLPPFAGEVEDWLQAGRARIAVGFGSMAASDGEAMLTLLGEAMSLVDGIAVVGGLSADGVPAQFSDRLLLVPHAPHRWLFPLVDAVVHHGGAGTTGAAFRAGRPQVVVPFAVDQPFWARRAVSLGVSPGFIPRRALSAMRLAEMLRPAFADKAFASTALRIGALIERENGVTAAVEAFDELATPRRSSRPVSPSRAP